MRCFGRHKFVISMCAHIFTLDSLVGRRVNKCRHIGTIHESAHSPLRCTRSSPFEAVKVRIGGNLATRRSVRSVLWCACAITFVFSSDAQLPLDVRTHGVKARCLKRLCACVWQIWNEDSLATMTLVILQVMKRCQFTFVPSPDKHQSL